MAQLTLNILKLVSPPMSGKRTGCLASLFIIILLSFSSSLVLSANGAEPYSIDEFRLPENAAMIDAMAIDQSGSIWLADSTAQVLYKFEPSSGSFDFHSMQSLEGARITGMSIDDSGIVWIADYDGNRVAYFSEADNNSWGSYKFPVTINPSHAVYSNGYLWIAGKEELGKLDLETNFLTDKWVSKRDSHLVSLCPDPYGNIWFVEYSVGKVGGYYLRFNDIGEKDIPTENSYPTCAAIDSKGRLWFIESGPTPDKLGMFDTMTEQFEEYDMPEIDGRNVSGHRIAIDKYDNVWFTDVMGSRLIKFIPDNKTFVQVRTDNGNSMPTLVSVDKNGDIWFVESKTKMLSRLHADPSYGLNPTPVPEATDMSTPGSSTPMPGQSPGFEAVPMLMAFALAVVAMKKKL